MSTLFVKLSVELSRCSQWNFRDSATANLRHILSPAETGSLEDHEREPSDDDQDNPLL